MKRISLLPLLVFVSVALLIPTAQAFESNSIVKVRPTMDGGPYFFTEQSRGLYQHGYHLGYFVSYSFEPSEVVSSATGARVGGVVNDLWVSNFTATLGILDWLNIGMDVPLVMYESFFNFIHTDASQCSVTNAVGCPQQTKTKIGDVLFGTKFRIIDPDRFPIGLSLQPFILFPTGSGYYLTGYGFVSGGAKLIFDVNFQDYATAAINVGYHAIKETNYAPNTPFAKINDLLLLSAALNVPINNDFQAIAEISGETLVENPFRHEIQSPFEALGGLRFSPGNIKVWTFGLGGGVGLGSGFGAPKYRGMATIHYKRTKVVELEIEEPKQVSEVESPYEEKIIITQKIHFEFNKAAVRKISFPILDDIAEVLKLNPDIQKIRVEGHTDDIGNDEYNLNLSGARAGAVRDYLIQRGIEESRVTAVGYGETRPIDSNENDLGRAKNRRTEFTVLETE